MTTKKSWSYLRSLTAAVEGARYLREACGMCVSGADRLAARDAALREGDPSPEETAEAACDHLDGRLHREDYPAGWVHDE